MTVRRYVPVAEIARPHGVRGELRVRLWNPASDLLLRRPPVRLRLPDGTTRDISIKSARAANKGLLVEFVGVDDRDAAEVLRGAEVLVPRDTFPDALAGEFYVCDLEGATAVLKSTGEAIGRVSSVQSYPTCDALVIDQGGGVTIEVPLVDAYVASVDVERALVEIVTLDGIAP